jgi:transposase
MATPNPEKAKAMKKAVEAVLGGEMDAKTAAREFGLHWRSVYNALARARQESRVLGLHPALRLWA